MGFYDDYIKPGGGIDSGFGSKGFGSVAKKPSRGFAGVSRATSPTPAATPQAAPTPVTYNGPSAGYGGAPAYQSPVYNTPSFGIGSPTDGGYGGAPAPTPQSQPVMSQSDWLAGDSEYQNQMSDFGTALSDFLARLTKQKNDFTSDYETAQAGLARNESKGLLNLGEDFTSRGLANSGLFANARQEAQKGFEDQRTGMTTARDRALADFSTQERDKRASTKAAQDNARRSSLQRMSAQQMF